MAHGKNRVRNRFSVSLSNVLNCLYIDFQGKIGCGMYRTLILSLSIWVATTGTVPTEAQNLNSLRNSSRNLTRHSLEALRTIIRPKLGIIRGQAGPVTGLHLHNDRSLLLTMLGDGTVRWWDLGRGVQLGSAVGNAIVSGALRGGGSDVIAVRSDGALIQIRADGTNNLLGKRIEFSSTSVPIVSGDGYSVVFYRNRGGWYWISVDSDSPQYIDDATRNARPVLSQDGLKVAYLTNKNTWVVRETSPGGNWSERVEIGSCVQTNTRVLTGTFTPDGNRIVFGDEQGGLCVWDISDQGNPKRTIAQRAAHSGAIRLIAIDVGGNNVALSGNNDTVAVWTIADRARQLATLKLAGGRPRSLLLDLQREWLFVGENKGTVGIYSIRKKLRIARLVSMDSGWAVLDREGRFDGSQNGFDGLVWAGETEQDTHPLDAFSENYFEPGLLTRLDDTSPVFLNEDIRNLSEDGYVRPPKVIIDPVNTQSTNPQDHLPVRVRVEPGYCCEVAAIRLYHNGKLVPANRASASPGGLVVNYLVQPLPDENYFTAVGVGPGGVEGPSASTSITLDVPEGPAPSMQVVAVGINEYNRPAWKLQYSRNDAETILDTLHKRADAVFDNVKAIKLLDSTANFQIIEEHIVNSTLSPHDVLVVYFAGHGYALRENERWEWYFLPFTTAWGEEDDLDLPTMIRRHGLSSQQLMGFLTETEPRRVFFILDSCRSGALVDTMKSAGGWEFTDTAGQKVLRKLARVGGIHVLAASRADEDAVELISAPHGALTYLVLEGMRGAADENQDNKFSVREIIGYANREMPLLSRRFVQESISQNPVDYSHGEDFILGEF